MCPKPHGNEQNNEKKKKVIPSYPLKIPNHYSNLKS